MARVLVLFAHPALEKSRVHRRLIDRMPALPGLTFHDLYEAYPDFDVDVPREQALLAAHDVVVLQHPLYWYSAPPLVKQWEDLVLEHGWAYGSEGTALAGKRLLCAITAGGGAAAYRHEGYNRFTIRELLAPIEQTARLCRMDYLPPYVVHGTHRLTDAEVEQAAERYRALLVRLHEDRLDHARAGRHATLNDALAALDGDGGFDVPVGAASDGDPR
jgi:glutathione-regulated potassium-efflux system ancillary protein KefG